MFKHSHLPPHNVIYCGEVQKRFGMEPRPCPFCSSKNIALWLGPTPHMVCAQCGAYGPVADRGADNDEKHARALWLWNNRVAL